MKQLLSIFFTLSILFTYLFASIPPINSSNLNFATSTGYSSSKVYSTIGQGTITVKDKENSDDITTLNRDTNKQTNLLYEGSVGTSVDASLDHRLLTEEGRASIKEDFKKSEILLGVIKDTITKESYSLFGNKEEGQTGYQDSMLKALGVYEASKKLISEYPEAAKILLDPNADADVKQSALQALHNLITLETGYDAAAVNVIVGALDKGFTSDQTKEVYISEDNHKTHGDLVRTDVHETSRVMDLQDNGLYNEQSDTYKINRTEYANTYGSLGQNLLNYVLTSNGYSSLNDITSNHIGSNILKPSELTNSVIISSREHQQLDLNQGGFRQLDRNEISVIEKHGIIFAEQLYGDNPTLSQVKDATARLAQEALRGVDAEWSLILGGGKEYDEAAREFLSNYDGMFKAKNIYEFNDGTTDGTYKLTLMTNEEVQNIKDFTSEYAYVSTSSGIEQQSISYAYIPYHDKNMIDGVTGVVQYAAFSTNPLYALEQSIEFGTALYEGKVQEHFIGSVNGAITFGELWLSDSLSQNIIDIYGQGQSGLNVQRFLHTGEALETTSYLFATVGARTLIGNINKVDNVVGVGSKIDDIGTRRTWQQSEQHVKDQLGDKAEAQVSFKDGETVTRGTSGSVRPDFCKTDGSCSIEVKNYNIATNQNGLINNVVKQAEQRAVNLPAGMTQQVQIDISGQVVSKIQQDAIAQKIVDKSGGIIKFDDIKFF
jgi:hypothetical protein